MHLLPLTQEKSPPPPRHDAGALGAQRPGVPGSREPDEDPADTSASCPRSQSVVTCQGGDSVLGARHPEGAPRWVAEARTTDERSTQRRCRAVSSTRSADPARTPSRRSDRSTTAAPVIEPGGAGNGNPSVGFGVRATRKGRVMNWACHPHIRDGLSLNVEGLATLAAPTGRGCFLRPRLGVLAALCASSHDGNLPVEVRWSTHGDAADPEP